MADKLICPNCREDLAKGHPGNGCVLGALFSCIADREGGRRRALMERLADVDECALWDDIGPIVDKLQDGAYNRA